MNDFFPEKGQSARANLAMITCMGCKVRRQCDDWRRTIGATHGVWAAQYLTRDSE